jgi:flavorubredoxin
MTLTSAAGSACSAVSPWLIACVQGSLMAKDAGSPHLDEIADGVYRISTYLEPYNITLNQFLVLAEEPLLFHLGFRSTFPAVHDTIARVIDPHTLRWLSFGHVEADECGALNQWLAAAPNSQVAFNPLGCMLSLDDLCDRPPVPTGPDDVLDLGGRRVRVLPTPHVPHNWEAQVMFEEATGTLLCGDVCATFGQGAAVTTDAEWLVNTALESEASMPACPPGPAVPAVLRQLADLNPRVLAVMHGPSFDGDGGSLLQSLATGWEAGLGGIPAPPQSHQ